MTVPTKRTRIARSEAEFTAALGTRLRDLRSAAGLRQDDIARSANGVGLPWGRSSVAALESGTRHLSAFEWLLLPSIYQCAVDDLAADIEIRATPPGLTPDETDRKVAARLGLTPEQVVDQSKALWGRSLAAERDARSGDGGSRSAQSSRGHITRALQAELEAVQTPDRARMEDQ